MLLLHVTFKVSQFLMTFGTHSVTFLILALVGYFSLGSQNTYKRFNELRDFNEFNYIHPPPPHTLCVICWWHQRGCDVPTSSVQLYCTMSVGSAIIFFFWDKRWNKHRCSWNYLYLKKPMQFFFQCSTRFGNILKFNNCFKIWHIEMKSGYTNTDKLKLPLTGLDKIEPLPLLGPLNYIASYVSAISNTVQFI